MMENINIVINKKTRQVNLSKSVIGNDGENLQEKFVFSFNDEFVDGTARLEILKANKEKTYIMLTKINDTYELPIKSIMTKVGKLDMQLVITEGINDNEIPIFKSNDFYVVVNPSINAVDEEPEGYDQWIDIADTKLNQIDNLDIEAEQTSGGATITITKKDGTQESVSLTNGQNGTNGQDGYSPSASVTQNVGSATISITDKNGTTTATINDGQRGVDGQDGENGITPTIGDNGNWYLGTTDTGKPSRGVQGETGATGQNGRDGYVQYEAGNNITISNNTINAIVPDISGKQDIFQYSTMPTASADNLGKIIQFIGTTGTYTNGYFYICSLENSTYSWIQLNVQPAGATDTGAVAEATYMTSSQPFVFDGKKKGIYVFTYTSDSTFWYKYKSTSNTQSLSQRPYMIILTEDFDTTQTSGVPGTIFTIASYPANQNGAIRSGIIVYGSNSVSITANSAQQVGQYLTFNDQTITGVKTFASTPQLSSYTAPTSNEQLVAKKYVDDKIGDINTILATLTTPSE